MTRVHRIGLVGVALLGLAGPAAAKDAAAAGFAALEACLGAALDPDMAAESCVGIASGQCMEATEGGWTTAGMVGCLTAELEGWEARLAAVLTELGARHAATDAENAETGMTLPSLAGTLEAFHAAWLAYRDAACEYEYAHWGGGTGGGPASVSCQLQITGAHTLDLAGRLREARLP